MQTLIFAILTVLSGSALFSGMEAALFSISLSRAKVLAEQQRKGSKSLVAIKENMRRPITVIVIFNNAFNIVGSIIIGVLAAQTLESAWIGAVSALLTFLIIIFGEIIPKSIGESYAAKISLFVAKPLLIATKIFYPFIWFIEKVTKPFTKKRRLVSEDEIRILSHLGHLEGSIEKDEKEMIHKVFKLNDLTAENIMTPREKIEALEENKTLGKMENKIYSIPHSRLPVYNKNLNKVSGICHQRDLLIALGKDQKDKKIKEFAQKAITIQADMKADDLLILFQKEKSHLAIVTDYAKKVVGVVSLEDVLEELVGEIIDEKEKI